MSEYAPPVNALLECGIPDFSKNWPNYVEEFGLNASHVQDLIQMVSDEDLYDSLEPKMACASIHARRALGQLKAGEAVGPLLEAMREQIEDDDYWLEEGPDILELIGPSAIPEAIQFLTDREANEYARGICATALGRIAASNSESREPCVSALIAQLDQREDHEGVWFLNALIVQALGDLKAVEAMPVIEQAFAADVVDESLMGGLATVKHNMGIGPEPVDSDIRPQWQLSFGRPAAEPLLRRPDPKKLLKKSKQQKAPKRKRKR